MTPTALEYTHVRPGVDLYAPGTSPQGTGRSILSFIYSPIRLLLPTRGMLHPLSFRTHEQQNGKRRRRSDRVWTILHRHLVGDDDHNRQTGGDDDHNRQKICSKCTPNVCDDIADADCATTTDDHITRAESEGESERGDDLPARIISQLSLAPPVSCCEEEEGHAASS